MPERRGRTIKLADAVRELLSGTGATQGLKQSRVVETWSKVVGPEIEQRTLSAGLRGGELIVQVDSHAWATELSLLSEELRTRLNSALGEEIVQTIRFTVSRSVSEARATTRAEVSSSRRYGGERVQPRPLAADEVAEIEARASIIEHEGVRQAVVRAQIRDRELKKERSARECAEGREEAEVRGAGRHQAPQDLW